ncbi:MAG: AmmeMemoRadiSam system protein B [Desulfurococcales archaeon ex4484_58]|nr:MAG: AmmeMemoRadiSam system protein B [Desulfurococcales archaeon ex4484_58]
MSIKDNIRYPVVAGYFYPKDSIELKDMIKKLFLHRYGPGKEPAISSSRRRETIGYLAPHAGYIYSGPIAAHTYYNLALDGKPETIIVIGTNHTGLGSLVSVYPSGKWITPLGELRVDCELAEEIVYNSELAELDTDAHLEEHSVEVQLPFIQYIFGNDIYILPIVLGLHSYETAEDLAKAINKATTKLNRDTIIIASSDLNHYDPYDITVEKDHKAIEKILSLDSREFYETIINNHITVCGPGGIMTLIEYTKIKAHNKNYKAELLKYANSGDISGDKSMVVGYASIRFYLT